MSTHILYIIPTSPDYIPSDNQQKEALRLVKDKYPRHEVTSEVSLEVCFVDQGQNFDKVSCNHCLVELEIDFWKEKMDEAYMTLFKNLQFKSNCCNNETSLNDLIYDMPAGFAKYVISIVNPEYEESSNSGFLSRIESVLDSSVKLIWAHY